MTDDPITLARQSQRLAADPFVSAFVSASAGSGKTKVLTDRLLRLMLAGARPERIQCLTYTRAAAAEMRLRLQKTLGDWVVRDDSGLDAALAELGLAPTASLRSQARRLFADVLDVPGGMRIETIHAFCTSLLRRFPLEAALPPRFAVLDDATAADLWHEARTRAIAETPASALDQVARHLDPDDFNTLVENLADLARAPVPDRDRPDTLAQLIAAQRRVLGLDPGETVATLLAAALPNAHRPRLRALMRRLDQHATATQRPKLAAALAGLTTIDDPAKAWQAWAGYFLKKDGDPLVPKYLVSAATKKIDPSIEAELLTEQARVVAIGERLQRVAIADLSAALLRVGLPMAWAYAGQKRRTGQLDYDDLIRAALTLLDDPGAAWVLYKLDGGLDHLLIDEAQDTSPAQWRIADRLTEEFFAGLGARETSPPRSLFAVGDHKQSIFSFQGAVPGAVQAWRQRLKHRVEGTGQAFHDVPLQVSFRSSPPVLALTDAVFAKNGPDLGLGDAAADGLRHLAHRANVWGRVELWPRLPRISEAARARAGGGGTDPEPDGNEAALAEALADRIAAMLAAGTPLPSRNRALRPGDILVLLRARGTFPAAFIRRLRLHQVPVAGPDRMKLIAEPAVADLLALADALLLPDDDFAFATFLTSPLGGLDDPQLMDLAFGRQGSLWQALRARADQAPHFRAAFHVFSTLLARVDFIAPYALFSLALGPLGGQARLLARFGAQSREAIGEFLDDAASHATGNPPSLQNFVHMLREGGAEVKQEQAGPGQAVRIMTVHGAKGLQAPLVFLQASTGLGRDRSRGFVTLPCGDGPDLPFWAPKSAGSTPEIAQARSATRQAEIAEHYRALYVALTRAEDWLIVCGYEPGQTKPEEWYNAIAAGFGRLADVEARIFEPWPGDGLSLTHAGTGVAPTTETRPAAPAAPVPAWLHPNAGWRADPPPPEPALPDRLAPSRPEGAGLGQIPGGALPLLARDAAGRRFARGTLAHTLLQHLPALPASEQEAAARRLASQSLPPDAAASLVAEVLAVINDPRLAPLFGPGSRAEVPIAGIITTATGPAVVGGVIDRLLVTPGRVMIADYKTNRDPPADATAIPALYRRQMATYRDILAQIHPDTEIITALVWTRNLRVDFLT